MKLRIAKPVSATVLCAASTFCLAYLIATMSSGAAIGTGAAFQAGKNPRIRLVADVEVGGGLCVTTGSLNVCTQSTKKTIYVVPDGMVLVFDVNRLHKLKATALESSEPYPASEPGGVWGIRVDGSLIASTGSTGTVYAADTGPINAGSTVEVELPKQTWFSGKDGDSFVAQFELSGILYRK